VLGKAKRDTGKTSGERARSGEVSNASRHADGHRGHRERERELGLVGCRLGVE
jgi:hypothetical protein